MCLTIKYHYGCSDSCIDKHFIKDACKPLLGKYDRIVSGVPELYVFSQPKQYNETAASEGYVCCGNSFRPLSPTNLKDWHITP